MRRPSPCCTNPLPVWARLRYVASMPEPRAVLLDIDGTLLRSAGAGARALALALADLLDLPLDDVVVAVGALDFRGATDQAAVHQLEVTLDVDLRTRHELLLQSYLGHLEQALAA